MYKPNFNQKILILLNTYWIFKPIYLLLQYYKLLVFKLNQNKYDTPHLTKQNEIIKLKNQYKIHVFVETSTYLGFRVMKKVFNNLISIEIEKTIFQRAKNLFEKYKNVKILLGDSGIVINDVLKDLNESANFWLNGHFSGANTGLGKKHTPILDEIVAICNHDIKKHIILIDDLRLFNGSDDYPSLNEFILYLKSRFKMHTIFVKYDFIYILPI